MINSALTRTLTDITSDPDPMSRARRSVEFLRHVTAVTKDLYKVRDLAMYCAYEGGRSQTSMARELGMSCSKVSISCSSGRTVHERATAEQQPHSA